MSNSFYHKDLTDAQWNRIKSLFPKANKVGRPALNYRMVLNAILWILKRVGMIYLPTTGIGGANSVFLKKSYK